MQKRSDADTTEGTESNTAALSAAEDLIDRLLLEAETYRSLLAQVIHDDLGGLMVSTAMDLVLVQRQATELNLLAIGPLERGRKSLHQLSTWPAIWSRSCTPPYWIISDCLRR